MKILEVLTSAELEKLHGYVCEANLIMMKYRKEGEKPLEFAMRCEDFATILQFQSKVFAEVVKRFQESKGE